jgi:hypothetical protein
MTSTRFSGPDAARSRLRATVATIESEISLSKDHSGSAPAGLLASWADLIDQLKLGPEPEVRECPACKHVGMRAATRCGYCWATLEPQGPDPSS